MILLETPSHYGLKRKGKTVKTSHLVSDTSEDELHEFAGKMGLKPEYFSEKSFPHYDITYIEHMKVCMHGAQKTNYRELVKTIRGRMEDGSSKLKTPTA